MKHFIIHQNKLLEVATELKGFLRLRVSDPIFNEPAFLYFRRLPAWRRLLKHYHLGVFPKDFVKVKALSKNKAALLVNGYKIRYSKLLDEFQVSHDKIGRCESFSFLDEAEKYCLKK